MKKIKMALAVAATTIVLTGCEQGSYLNLNTKQMDSDAVARLTATGNDLRVYEFTPQTAPNKQCVSSLLVSRKELWSVLIRQLRLSRADTEKARSLAWRALFTNA